MPRGPPAASGRAPGRRRRDPARRGPDGARGAGGAAGARAAGARRARERGQQRGCRRGSRCSARWSSRACGSGWSTTPGPRPGRLERMRRRFPDAQAVIFGHCHIPLHETAADGFQIFNPGSPTERRRQPDAHAWGIAHDRGWKDHFRLDRIWDSKIPFETWLSKGPPEVTDPKAMRALAHPVRIALLEALDHPRAADRDRGGRARGGEPGEHVVPPAPAGQVRLRGGGRGRDRAPAAVEARSRSGCASPRSTTDPETAAAARELSRSMSHRYLERAAKGLEENRSQPDGVAQGHRAGTRWGCTSRPTELEDARRGDPRADVRALRRAPRRGPRTRRRTPSASRS